MAKRVILKGGKEGAEEERKMMNFPSNLDQSKVTHFDRYLSLRGVLFDKDEELSDDEILDLGKFREEAELYLKSHEWCSNVPDVHVGLAYPGILAVFLCSVESDCVDVDDWLWVVVGDIPPAYLVCDDLPDPISALRTYVCHRTEWIDAVRTNKDVSELMPVNVPPSKEWADELERRLKFLTCIIRDDHRV